MVRGNRNAASFAFLSILLLAPGVFLPFLSMVKFGHTETYSLVGGIVALFEDGSVFLGLVILIFSLVFPCAKLAILLLITTSLVNLSMAARRRLHHISVVTAKYSMLDVFVVGILVVVIKFGSTMEVQARWGTVLFCGSIFLSMLAGMCVDLSKSERSNDE